MIKFLHKKCDFTNCPYITIEGTFCKTGELMERANAFIKARRSGVDLAKQIATPPSSSLSSLSSLSSSLTLQVLVRLSCTTQVRGFWQLDQADQGEHQEEKYDHDKLVGTIFCIKC